MAAASWSFSKDGYDLLWSDPCGFRPEVSGRYLWVAPDGAGAGEQSDLRYAWPRSVGHRGGPGGASL